MNNLLDHEKLFSICLSILSSVSSEMMENNKNIEVRSEEKLLAKKAEIKKTEMGVTQPTEGMSVVKEENDSNSSHEEIEEIKKIIKKSNTKPFKCTFENCEKSFEYKWILDRHINSHFCFKMFKCDYKGCEKAYKSRENLTLHYKNKHLGVKPYECQYCQAKFSHRNGIY